jgi:3-deoxy-D-manno-octulosonate cytidylyltransferase
MVTKNYTDLEFLSMIEKVNGLNPYSFYIVDSFGSMTLDEFHKYSILADSNLARDIALGYHSHNNMQLAFSNAVSMCSMNLKRDIIVDASIYGIGRGAGNLNTELMADFLNKSYDKSYDTLPLLEIIDEFLSSLMKKKSWGFSPAQFLSASFNCHPNYATYLINKNTIHIVDIKKILEKISDNEKSSLNKNLIEQIYINSILEEKTSIKGTFDLDKNKKILLIASGKSVSENKDLITSKVDDENYISIALNHIPDFETDFYFFTNQKRFDEFGSKVDLSKTIITNNIFTDLNSSAVLDFKALAFIDDKLVTNVAVVLLNHLISLGIKEVEIAGLDGYKASLDNYNYEETTFITDQKALIEENESLRVALQNLQKNIKIDFITPSIYKDSMNLKIIGVIPARYKSSRFEGKPLCIIKGVPMIKRTYEQAKKSKLLDRLVVATDSTEIKNYCESEGIPVVMTSENCLTGTDRIAEVSKTEHYDLYVNIQGDEPIIDPKSIDEIVEEFQKYGDKYVAYNLYKIIDDISEINSNTIIKTIVNEKDELMYMSRLGIPFNKSDKDAIYKKQVCVYGFTKQALKLFASRSKTLNEQYEDIEILRFLDMGYKVKMRETKVDSIAVDIPKDVKKVEKFLDENGLD